ICRADDVGAGLLRLLGLLALGEDGHRRLLAGSVGKHERAAELLVGVADVQAEPEVHLDRLVELRRLHFLEQADGLHRRVLVLATGVMRPFSAWVCALKALQNSMMLTPCCPSAGPTGGAGLACPPGICSLMIVRTFLAISRVS